MKELTLLKHKNIHNITNTENWAYLTIKNKYFTTSKINHIILNKKREYFIINVFYYKNNKNEVIITKNLQKIYNILKRA